MKDFWQSLTLFERFCLELWGILLKFAVIASIAGCGAVVAGPADTEYDAALIAIADADMERPELPDSLDDAEPTGVSDNSGISAPVSDKLPQVQLFVTDGCPPCVEAKKWLKGSKIPWVQMPMPNPAWCDKKGYPSLAWQTKDGWGYWHGWTTGADFEAYYRRSLK